MVSGWPTEMAQYEQPNIACSCRTPFMLVFDERRPQLMCDV